MTDDNGAKTRKARKKAVAEVRLTQYEGEDAVQWSLKQGDFSISNSAENFAGAFEAAQETCDKFDIE